MHKSTRTQEVEDGIKSLSAAWIEPNRNRTLAEVLVIVKKPGWTTRAELLFIKGIVGSLGLHTLPTSTGRDEHSQCVVPEGERIGWSWVRAHPNSTVWVMDGVVPGPVPALFQFRDSGEIPQRGSISH
jgi:hypothetical protein